MKKHVFGVSAILCAAALATAALSVSADGEIQFYGAEATAPAGGSFSMDLNLADIPEVGISTMDFSVSYDPALVSVTSVVQGDLMTAADAEAAYETYIDAENGVVNIVWASGADSAESLLQGDGVLLTLNGLVSAEAEDGAVAEFTIGAVNRETYPESGLTNEDVVVGTVSDDAVYDYEIVLGTGTLSIYAAEDFLLGDVNADGNVDSDDAVLVLKAYTAAMLGTDNGLTDTQLLAANINGGELDSDDAVLILRYYTASMLGEADWAEILS